MKIPKDVNYESLIKLLKIYGYSITRQTGSHIRLTSIIKGNQHHITVPKHKNLKTGTLNGILNEVANYLEIDKESLIHNL
ncbi:MAG: type II toxin-antitoxin system HicA family toxin [Actinobacteria bacterium]|nr:type II toxin-antitoxin system HicA family toxin [Actinomycetota bacterium]